MAKKTAKKSTKKSRGKTASKNKESGIIVRSFKFCIKWGFIAAIWLSIFVGALMALYASELPTITKSMVFERRPTVIIKSKEGEIVDRYGDIKGEIVDAKDLPPHLINAILATEDRRFYQHYGMDFKGFMRAVVVNLKAGGFVQGGSTITQQLAKNLFLTRDRTIKRKIQELMLSFQLEKELTKDEILSAYLNRVYLGSGAYGVDAAARVYFNKSAQELNLREAATIAGLLKAPSRYSPKANPKASAERTNTVLQSMVDAGYVAQADLVKQSKIPPAPKRKPSSGESVRYFTDYIVSQLDDLIGPVTSDIVVETTLDMDIQKEMEESITKALLEYGEKNDVAQAAGITVGLDGRIVALMGGKDYGISEFNRVTDSLRPPGSSFKPIVYLAAIENGWNLNSLIVDEPIIKGRYRPKNFGHQYYGEVTLYTALTNSLNTVAVNLMRDVGPEKTIELARRLGITADLEPNLSTALGSSGVPMIQMVTAYATLGRGGIAVTPYSIKRILDKDGNVLYERTPPKNNDRVVNPNAVAQINVMMQSVIQNGTGRSAAIPYQAAGKTGTSQDFRDAWFIGFTNRYSTAIWFGNDDNSPTKRLTGGSAPARVWRDVMVKAQQQGGPAYNTFSNFVLTPESSFDDLLMQILQNDDGGNYRGRNEGWFGGLFNRGTNAPPDPQVPENAPEDQYTPLGRHQWDVND
jgi:penicillin-binding protein 1A